MQILTNAMNKQKLDLKLAGLEPWKDNFGNGMERRGNDNMSWYDLSINANSAPCDAKLAIIVTAWFGQLKWLRATLEQYRRSGAFVILAYDMPFYAWAGGVPIVSRMPKEEHYLLANAVVHKHITYDADKRNGWFWSVRYAQGILKQFKNIEHVYCTNGDCIIEKPDGFEDVIEALGSADITTGQSTESTYHTATIFSKIEAFHQIFDHMGELMRVPILGSRSPEGMLKDTIDDLGLDFVHMPEQPLDKDGTIDSYARYDPPSTWKKLLGFKNLFAIQETAWNDGLEPLDKKYVDNYMDWIYFAGDEKETICKYYETNDRRYLYKWWDCGEDSWYNRLYYPLEHYGKEPIYG